MFIFHKACDDRINRSPSLVAGKGGRCAEHVADSEEGLRAQFDISLAIDGTGIGEEALVAGDVRRVERGDRGVQRRVVVGIVEPRPVGPVERIEGRDRHQLDIARHVPAGQRPQPGEAVGIGDDRRPGVEQMAVAAPVIGAPAGLVARLDDRRRDSRRLQPDGQGKAAEPGPDHDRPLHFVSRSAPSARATDTGGRPARMRSRSPSVERPA